MPASIVGAKAAGGAGVPAAALMAADHARLDGLLAAAQDGARGVRAEPFWEFRQGLLRHIGLEEKIILPALIKSGAAPLELAAKLRLDHGALTALLSPEPSLEIVRVLRAVLAPHNRLEEGAGGFYRACAALSAAAAQELLLRLQAAPAPPLRPYSQSPRALEAAKRALLRAGFAWDFCASRP